MTFIWLAVGNTILDTRALFSGGSAIAQRTMSRCRKTAFEALRRGLTRLCDKQQHISSHAYKRDGGHEAEVAAFTMTAPYDTPHRVGLTLAKRALTV